MLRGLRDGFGALWSSFPLPRQQLVKPCLRMVGDLRDDVAEPGMRIDVVEAAGLDQRVHGGRPVTAAVRAAEGPVPAPDGNGSHPAFRGIVGHADPAVRHEAGKAVPA